MEPERYPVAWCPDREQRAAQWSAVVGSPCFTVQHPAFFEEMKLTHAWGAESCILVHKTVGSLTIRVCVGDDRAQSYPDMFFKTVPMCVTVVYPHQDMTLMESWKCMCCSAEILQAPVCFWISLWRNGGCTDYTATGRVTAHNKRHPTAKHRESNSPYHTMELELLCADTL